MNSKLLKVYIGGILASALLFSSCDTFLQGSNLKNQLDEVIKDANAERVKVSVFALNAYGTLTGETGGTYKVETENLSLGFSENKGWQFVEWQVSDSEGNKKGIHIIQTLIQVQM